MSVNRVPTFYPSRINMRVANLAFASDVMVNNGDHAHRLALVAPIASSISAIGTLTVSSTATTHANSGNLPYTFADPYGRHPIVAGTTSSNTGVSTLFGKDYLGQSVIAAVTNAGSGAVNCAKAFKVLNSVIHGGHAGGPVSIGYADRFGLPYKSMALKHSFLNGLSTAAHTLTAPDTSTASAAGSDPRGSITLNVAADGTKNFDVILSVDGTNLHGAAHYSG